jgi:hypothetical protein
MTNRRAGCSGPAAKGSFLEDTQTGQDLICAGCVAERRLVALKANVGELQRQHHELVGATFSGSLDRVERARAAGIAEGVATAVLKLTGSDMSDHRDAGAVAAELLAGRPTASGPWGLVATEGGLN